MGRGYIQYFSMMYERNMNRVQVLNLLLEILENMNYYPSEGDDFYSSLKQEIELQIKDKK